MGNKFFIFLNVIFFGCNNQKGENVCDLRATPMGNYVVFKGFNTIDKMIFQDISSNKSYLYNRSNLESNGDKEFRLKINTNTISLIENGCYILIDSDVYKILDVKMENIQRATMWNKKIFCELKEYKLNDSLIMNRKIAIFYRKKNL